MATYATVAVSRDEDILSGPLVNLPQLAYGILLCGAGAETQPLGCGVRPPSWRCRKSLRTTGAAAGDGGLCCGARQARACGPQARLGGLKGSFECGAVCRALNLVLLQGQGHSSSVPIEPLCFILQKRSSRRTHHLLPPNVHMHTRADAPVPDLLRAYSVRAVF